MLPALAGLLDWLVLLLRVHMRVCLMQTLVPPQTVTHRHQQGRGGHA